ncbi:MAG: hypothetical protein FWG80_03315 [Alphaproteobacteria bacterium]|nr:hypothetical protein [Alphaproteobacteria bacterium]
MKKLLIFLFLIGMGSAFAEDSVVIPDATTDANGGQINKTERPDDFTGKLWIQYGFNGSLTFSPNSNVSKKIDEITGQKNKLNNGFVGGELRLGYNINHWLGLWVGGIWKPPVGNLDFITVTKKEELYPGSSNYVSITKMYDLSTDIKYKEYFVGTRTRIGETGGFLFSLINSFTNSYWFVDLGLSRREMTVTYSSRDFEIDGITDIINATTPYFGMGTEIMFGEKMSLSIDANATSFLSKFGKLGMSFLIKYYF